MSATVDLELARRLNRQVMRTLQTEQARLIAKIEDLQTRADRDPEMKRVYDWQADREAKELESVRAHIREREKKYGRLP